MLEVRMRNKKPIMTDKQLEALLAKGARGVITQLAQYAKKEMQYFTKRNLYDQVLVDTKNRAYDRSRYLYGSIESSRTESSGDSFYSEVAFDKDYIRAHAEKPTYKKTKKGKLRMVKFGRYTDIHGDYVGDEMIEEGWIEDGTGYPSIVPRGGAHIMEDTVESIDRFLAQNGVEAELKREFGTVVIEKFT